MRNTLLTVMVLTLAGCLPQERAVAPAPVATAPAADAGVVVLADFERPTALQVALGPGPATAPAGGSVARVPDQPHGGLWCMDMRVREAATLVHPLETPRDLSACDTFVVRVRHGGAAAHTGSVTAAAVLVDETGRQTVGDAYPLSTRWEEASLDLRRAGVEVDLRRIVAAGVRLARTGEADTPLAVLTDTWTAAAGERTYVGRADGAAGTFHVRRGGGQLTVETHGAFTLTFHNRGSVDGRAAPWLELRKGGQQLMGQAGTGLMLLDQAAYEALGPVDRPAIQKLRVAPAPPRPYPGSLSTAQWNVVWATEAGALVEVKQVAGPYDGLGRPAWAYTWRFMIHPSGQVYVQLTSHREGNAEVLPPMSIALAYVGDSAFPNTPDIHPVSWQQASPVAMLPKFPGDNANLWWAARAKGADDQTLTVFGAALPFDMRQGALQCLLNVDDRSALDALANYAMPVMPAVTSGALDRTYPGDRDNDGFVDAYGFYAMRLTNGRGAWSIGPQGKFRLGHPLFLVTLPPEDRVRTDLAAHDLMIAVDGKALTGIPRFTDGGFLVRLPWTIARPVQVEARLVPRAPGAVRSSFSPSQADKGI